MGSVTHEETFQARHYECDAAGPLYYASYMRYLQETALAATAAVGYDVARYEEMGRQWLIRETGLTIMRLLSYGDRVVIRTEVAGLRRIHSRRLYEMRMADTGELVATAHTDWIFVDVERQRPVSVPEEIIAALFPGGAVTQPRHERFPDLPPAPPHAFRVERGVRWSDLDMARHVNNAQYVAFIEDALADHLAAHDWTFDRFRAHRVDFRAGHWWIDYRAPARFGDRLAITTWFVCEEDGGLYQYASVARAADDEILAQARVAWLWTARESGNPVAIPAAFAEAYNC